MAQGLRSDLPDVSVLHRLIAATRRLLRSAWTITGLGLTVGLGLLLLVVVSLTDLAIPLRPWLRLTGLLLVVIPSGVAFIHGVLRPLFRTMTSRFVARRIEAKLPGIHNRLVSCVDLDSQKQQKFSLAFLQRLISEAIERVKDFRPWSVVDRASLRRAGLLLAVGVLVFATALGIFSDRLPTALARIFSPFADIPPATGVLFDVQPGTCKVLRGEPVDFIASVTKGKVDRLRLEISPIDGEDIGKTLWHELRLTEDGHWAFRLPAYDHSFEYRIHGGGTWTKLATVTMLERPRLAGLQASVHYPSYMGQPEPRVNPPDVADVTGPIESTVEVQVRVEGDPSVGEIQLLREDVRVVSLSSRLPRFWFDTTLPKGHAVEGNWEWQPIEQPAAQNGPTPVAATEKPTDSVATAARWHSHPTAPGLSYHLFHSVAVPFEVHLHEVLFVEVLLTADQPAEELMLHFHDGQNWERRVFWGADKISVGQPDTISRHRAGELPKPGEWVRLEVPARELDLEGRVLRGVSFAQFGGKCQWGRVGTLPAGTREVREFVVTDTFPLQRVSIEHNEQTEKPSADNVAHSHKSKSKPKSGSSKSLAAAHFARVREAETWSGTFPIKADGWYRVELKNEIGAANLPMKEARITAIPDSPPQIMIERPGVDLVLSEPIKVPVVIAAFDDFGLGELVLSVQKEANGAFQGRPVKTYSTVLRADTAIVMLDLAGESLKSGDVLKYRAEVRDRKGQTAQTQDYSIRIAPNDPNAADKKLAALEKQENDVREKLDKLITEQQKIQEKLEKLEEQHKPLTEKIEAAQDAAEQAAEAAAQEQAAKDQAAKDQPNAQKADPQKPDAKKPADAKTPETKPIEKPLDAATQKELAELQQELNQLQQQEQKNAAEAQQLGEQIKALANDAAQQQLVPPELQREVQQLSEAFQQAAVKPLKELANDLQQAAQPKQQDPKLPQLEARGEQALQNLEELRDRMESVRDATKDLRNDAAKALEELRQEMAQQAGELSARELEALRKAIEALREKLQSLAENESQLMEFTPDAPEMLLSELEKKQSEVDRKAAKELAKTKELQRSEPYQKLRRQEPKPTDSLDQAAVNEKPSDDGTSEPESPPSSEADPQSEAGLPEAAPDEPDFKPALADPTSAQKATAKDSEKKPNVSKPNAPKTNKKPDPSGKTPPANAEQRREQLADRQADQLDQLKMADESLAADQRTLDELLKDLQEALNPDSASEATAESQGPLGDKPAKKGTSDGSPIPSDGEPSSSDPAEPSPASAEQAAALAELMRSETFQKAMQMAARSKAMATGKSTPQKQPGQNSPANQPPPLKSNPQLEGALEAHSGNQFAMEAVLKELDPATRSALLKMQPRVREELLQGLREDGPEGYQRFIRDYFERLTKAGQGTRK